MNRQMEMVEKDVLIMPANRRASNKIIRTCNQAEYYRKSLLRYVFV